MSELEAVIAEEKAKLVESKKLRMLYLDEEDMIEAGVMAVSYTHLTLPTILLV